MHLVNYNLDILSLILPFEDWDLCLELYNLSKHVEQVDFPSTEGLDVSDKEVSHSVIK